MSENFLIFTYKNEDMIVQCSNEEKMKDIIQRFGKKINKDLNSLKFLLGGNQINLELTFKEQISLIENRDVKMKILVYINEEKTEYILILKRKAIILLMELLKLIQMK